MPDSALPGRVAPLPDAAFGLGELAGLRGSSAVQAARARLAIAANAHFIRIHPRSSPACWGMLRFRVSADAASMFLGKPPKNTQASVPGASEPGASVPAIDSRLSLASWPAPAPRDGSERGLWRYRSEQSDRHRHSPAPGRDLAEPLAKSGTASRSP